MLLSLVINGLLGTICVIAVNIVLALAFTGIGLTVRRAFCSSCWTIHDAFLAFWMGFGSVILFLMLWNFALPVGPASLAIILLAGLTGMGSACRLASRNILKSGPPLWSVLAAVLFCLWVANLSLSRMTYWDTGLYQMQAVQWARSYPVLPGLANVFGPVGFNNSSILYDAMLDAAPWLGRGWRVSNGLLISMFGAQLIASAGHFLRRRTPDASVHVFALLLLPAALFAPLEGRIPSFATAEPTALLVMVVAIGAYRAFADGSRDDSEKAYDFFSVTVLAAIAVSMKTSSAVFGAAILGVSCYGILHLGGSARRQRSRTLIWSLIAVSLVGLTWAIRSVILSGYPLFPSQILSVPVDWRVPVEHARAEFDFVVHSARRTAENYDFISGVNEGFIAWFPGWFRGAYTNVYQVIAPAGLAVIVTGLFLLSNLRATPENRMAVRPGWLMLGPLGVAIGAWFAVAPMPRYGAPFFWSVAALIGTQAFRLRIRSVGLARTVFVAGCLLGVSPCLVVPVWSDFESLSFAEMVDRILKADFVLPDQGRWYETGEPVPELREFRTDTGLTLNVPTGPLGRCWDAPVPCTPNPAPNLRLRTPGRIQSGFAVSGGWQMQDWPEPWRPRLLEAMRAGWRKRDATLGQ